MLYRSPAGVVGGVLGLVALAILACFLFRRRGRYPAPNGTPGLNPLASDPAMVVAGYEPQKLYSPSDHTTFPTRVPDGDPSYPSGRTASPFRTGRYGGAPEL